MHQLLWGGGGRMYVYIYLYYATDITHVSIIAYTLGRDVCIKNVLVDIAHLYIIYE